MSMRIGSTTRSRCCRASARRALYVQTAIARYKMWHGETYKITAEIPSDLPPGMAEYMRAAKQLHETRRITPEQRERAISGMEQAHPRLRTARAQFVCEYLLFCGEPDLALDAIKVGVDAGLLDHQWMQHCPLLEPLRSRPEFQSLAAIVASPRASGPRRGARRGNLISSARDARST